MRRGATHQKKLCSGSIFVHPRAAIFGTNSVVEYANIFQLHCLCKSSAQLFFVSDNSGLAWIWKELCSPQRRRHHCLEKYIKWSIFFWIQSQQTYLHDSEALYDELLHELYQFAWKADLLSSDVSPTGEQIGEKLNNLCQKKMEKTNCSVGLSVEFGRRNVRKLLPEKFFRPPDNPPNLPSVQNNHILLFWGKNLLLSGILHFFPFSGQSPEFWDNLWDFILPAPPPYIPKKK